MGCVHERQRHALNRPAGNGLRQSGCRASRTVLILIGALPNHGFQCQATTCNVNAITVSCQGLHRDRKRANYGRHSGIMGGWSIQGAPFLASSPPGPLKSVNAGPGIA